MSCISTPEHNMQSASRRVAQAGAKVVLWRDMLHICSIEQAVMHCLSVQTEGVFNRTLEAIKSAGAVLVPFNASSVVEYNDKYIGDPTLYTTELGGALSRYTLRQASSTLPQSLSMPTLM